MAKTRDHIAHVKFDILNDVRDKCSDKLVVNIFFLMLVIVYILKTPNFVS